MYFSGSQNYFCDCRQKGLIKEGCCLKPNFLKNILMLLVVLLLYIAVKDLAALPVKQNINVGDPLLPQLAGYRYGRNPAMQVYSSENNKKLLLPGGIPIAGKTGPVKMKIKLLGVIPFRQVSVNVVDPVEVMVGGHSIGIFLRSEGVLVVSYTPVGDSLGFKYNPAEKAGILPGDIIVKINGRAVKNDKLLQDEIDTLGNKKVPINLEVKRGKRTVQISLSPLYCRETGRYRIGLFVRNNTAGMGTLTFYEPTTKIYGALGHMVTDADTSRKIDLAEGQITNAVVQGIYPGKAGKPGEKVGYYRGRPELLGEITKNTSVGIFGRLRKSPAKFFYKDTIPVAMCYEIKEGPAQILTVLKGDNIECFDIEIQKIILRNRTGGKGLVIRVTDQKLISKTGGIIQGMSGSPIIQKGKFVGAVTHVFINDPKRGFGVPAEWMLREAGFFFLNDDFQKAA
ncbi:MAG: Stage IV sporulation protein B [Desulfotomaculum sp. 46_296]|nr:MAG: Stage IV sporulation protein B [Desulfotomaculum sp. 46_296]